MKNEIILFENQDVKLEVNMKDETVWLNAEQMAKLFDRYSKTIRKHINNALKEELDNSTIANFATVQKEGNRKITRNIYYYNLDMIISVGYRVKSQNGISILVDLELTDLFYNVYYLSDYFKIEYNLIGYKEHFLNKMQRFRETYVESMFNRKYESPIYGFEERESIKMKFNN